MEPIEDRSDYRSKLILATPSEVFAALSVSERVAKWWRPKGFTNTIHKFDFFPGGQWLLTMHGPDGMDYPNESRFIHVEPGKAVEIEHLTGHHFILRLDLSAKPAGTMVRWRQTFDTVAHYKGISEFVAAANEQNLERLAQEASASRSAA